MQSCFEEEIEDLLFKYGLIKKHSLYTKTAFDSFLSFTHTRVVELIQVRLDLSISAYTSLGTSETVALKIIDRLGLDSFLEDTPQLLGIIKSVIENCFLFWEELFIRFKHDQTELENLFGIGEKVKDVIWLGRETHDRGKMAIELVTSNDCSIIYKPRPCSSEIFWNDCVDYLNSLFTSQISITYQILDKRDYGWNEKVNYLECKGDEEVKQFYYRSGILLSVFVLLGSRDIVRSNLIACGSYPVLIDAETIIYPSGESLKDDKMFIDNLIKCAMLPQVLTSIGGASTITSALAITLETISQKVSFSDNTKQLLVDQNTYNIPFSNGKKITLIGYENNVLKGFINGDEIISRSSFSKMIIASLTKHKPRCVKVFRPTAIYYAVQQFVSNELSMGRKISLEKSLSQMNHFGNLEKEEITALSQSEAHVLINGDIPKFHFKLGTTKMKILDKTIQVCTQNALDTVNLRFRNWEKTDRSIIIDSLKKYLNELTQYRDVILKQL